MSNTFMIKVRPASAIRTVMELSSDTLARAVDPMVYRDTKKLSFVGAEVWSPLKSFASYTFVVLKTGFEGKPENHTVVYVDPKNEHLANERLNRIAH